MNHYDALQAIIHYGSHFVMPGVWAIIFFKDIWKKAWAMMLATMLIDLDHLLAIPMFDPERCSIGFHPLHSYPAIGLYTLMLMHKRTRIIAIGLLWHMVTDFNDCLWPSPL